MAEQIDRISRDHRWAKLFGVWARAGSGQLGGANGRIGSPARPRQLSWHRIGASVCVTDFVISLLCGIVSIDATSEVPAAASALEGFFVGVAPFATVCVF